MARRSATLITSGAYIDAELAAELGLLPPAFLPVGNRRLFEHQLEALAGSDGELHLSIPQDFEPAAPDQLLLERASVRLLRVNPRWSLGRSIHSCLEQMEMPSALEILHGDTLLNPPRPATVDAMSVGEARDGYHWAAAKVDGGRLLEVRPAPPHRTLDTHPSVLSGYFSLSDPQRFADLLAHHEYDFIRALNAYVMERPVRCVSGANWLDFGHLQTFFRSRGHLAAARSFNDLRVARGVVTKRSVRARKLAGEAHWFQNVPPEVRVYTARLVEAGPERESFAYSTEYEYLPSLAELYVFGRLNRPTWARILEGCAEFLTLAASIRSDDAPQGALELLTVLKTEERLASYAASTGFDLTADRRINGHSVPSVERIVRDVARIVGGAPRRAASLMHGDFCFSNILYNSKTERVRLIDPRGSVSDDVYSVFGDYRYDIAKLAHSVVGRYDLIVCGRAGCELRSDTDHWLSLPVDAERTWLEEAFSELIIENERMGSELTWACMTALFLSMLPLHADRPDHQQAFLANALQLYQRFLG